MTNTINENNQTTIMGEIVSDFTYSHEIFGEGFYVADVSVNRLSGNLDIIQVMISDRLLDMNADYKGMFISVNGQFRSYNRYEGSRYKLMLYVLAREIYLVEDVKECSYSNQIYLDGFICRKPAHRKTPLGREVADLFMAVNRPYGKSDYIPCICWGRNAGYVSTLSVGGRCIIQGRIQSREYMKKIDDVNMERRMAYEVSISKLKVAEEDR